MPLAPTRIIPITRKALSFDGVDDYVQVPHSDIFNSNSVTVAVYFRAFPGYGSGANSGLVAKRSGPPGSWIIVIHRSDGKIWGRVWQSDGTPIDIPAKFTIQPGTWYFAALVADGSEAKLLVNGEQVSSAEYDGTILSTTYDITIGKQGAEYFNGEIAYVLIYNRALSDDEIAQIYNDPDHPPKSGLILWLHDTSIDTENNVWRDLSGNGNDATIYGATAVDVARPATRVLDATRVIEPTR